MNDGWDAAWRSALDALELSVERAEELLRASHPVELPAWEAPMLTGPPPPDMMQRARLLLDRHLDVAQRIAAAAAATRQQLALAAKLTQTAPKDRPIYLDVTA